MLRARLFLTLAAVHLQDYVKYYARAAKLFVEEAGGDGVEVHKFVRSLVAQK